MISLIPIWARNSEEFWNSVRQRNLWFIKLRYGAVCLLALLLVSLELFTNFSLTRTQLFAVTGITLCILFYNLLLHKIRKRVNPGNRFNNLHLSLIQMILDLTTLTLLIHYTGGIETPFFMFYIFHMIIGSMILPGIVIYSITLAVIISFSTITFFEYSDLIPHHAIPGLLSMPIYNNLTYLLILLVVFSMMMIISVTLANKIARQLYESERQLWDSLNKLKDAEAEKQKYIMGVVHEIKTPVVAVQSILDLILQQFLGPVSDNVSDKLSRARNRTEEAVKLLNNILHISKIRLLDRLSSEKIDIAAMLNDLICKYSSQAEVNKISLVLKSENEKVSCIEGDRGLLEMSFSNLISNAIKYNHPDGIVEISVTHEKNFVQVNVSDNGIGIPQADINKVFDEFYRASNTRIIKFEGSGLGLSLVQQIIKRHGGRITLKSPSEIGSTESPGTTVEIILPITTP